MRGIETLLCCALAVGAVWGSAPVSGQIPTTRPRTTTQSPPPAGSAPKSSAASEPDGAAKPDGPAARPGQTPPRDAPAGSTFVELQGQIADAIRQGQLGRALTLAERQRTLYPNEMKASADLAGVYLLRGDAARAEPVLRAAITQKNALYSGNVQSLLGEIYTSLGQIALDSRRPTDAISFLLRAVDNAPTASRARYLLAAALDMSGDPERASREIRAAFDVDSASARPADYRLLARTARATGDAKAAVTSLFQATARFPMDVSLRMDYAASLVDAKQPTRALFELLYLKSVLRADAPQHSEIDGRIEKLRAEAEASKPEPEPQLEAMFSYLADAESEQHDSALPTIQYVVAMDEGSSVVPLLLLGRSLKATGRFGEAERVLLALAEREPQSVPILAELADLYYAEGRLEGARRVVDRAEKVDPQNPRLVAVTTYWK